ncbi:MAG: hypothetical protein KF878_35540 [Planctomycetes bacterium]|nr:hypothetical protein [Planctomycetota bacterium]
MRATGLLLCALLGLVAHAAPAVAQSGTPVGPWRCSYCHQPMSGAHRPGCPQGGGAGSGSSGASIGQAIGQAFVDAWQQAAAEAEWARQQRAAEEAARREAEAAARRALAVRLRASWDQRDAEHARALASIFDRGPRALAPADADPLDVPLAPPLPFHVEPQVDGGVVDLRGTLEGATPLPFEAWSRTVALDLEAQRRRAADTAAHARGLASLGPAPGDRGASPPALLERLTAQPRAALGDLLDGLGPMDGAPTNAVVAAKRLLLCVDEVHAGLAAERLVVVGQPGGEARVAAALAALDRTQARTLAHASGDASLEPGAALLLGGATDAVALRGLADRHLREATRDRAERAARARLLGR